jgi:hypothetical protein
MLSEAIRFFAGVPAADFFFGTVWDPRFAGAGSSSFGQFGLIPLLLGTLYIGSVAMLFAVPVGLFAAIYMAEYASACRALGCQAAARSSRRHSDHRLRLLRSGHGRPVPARYLRAGQRPGDRRLQQLHPGAERSDRRSSSWASC